MKEIYLTQGKVAFVNDEDFEKLNQYKWYASWSGWTWYAKRNSPRINGKHTAILMHREVMDAPKGMQVDHRNSDGLFNCKENLRLYTNQENGFNQKRPHRDNKLKIKGVRLDKRKNKFEARIKTREKQTHLGYFNVLGDADSAYRKAEEKYFGVFARKVSDI